MIFLESGSYRESNEDDDDNDREYMSREIAYGVCPQCNWMYSERAYRANRVKHFSYCSDYNRNGIEE